MRRLRSVVDCFGRGDFSARAPANRKDELGELARSFNQMAGRIQTLLAAERRLLLDISHELRSPLARLGVAVELARSGEDREHMLDRIQKEADRLNELVGELLQVTRVEADPSMQKTDTVHLDELLADLVYDSLLEAKAKDCTLLLKAPVSAIVSGDEELIRRALENVIRNAIRYAPRATAVDIELAKYHDAAIVTRSRLRPRRSRRCADQNLRSVLPRGFGPQPRERRPGPGPGDRTALGAIAQRQTHRAECASGFAGDHGIPHRPGGWERAVFQAGLRLLLRFQQFDGGRQQEQIVGDLLVVDLHRSRKNLVNLLAVAVALDGKGPLDAVAGIAVLREMRDLFVPVLGDRIAAEENLPYRKLGDLIEINGGGYIVGVG